MASRRAGSPTTITTRWARPGDESLPFIAAGIPANVILARIADRRIAVAEVEGRPVGALQLEYLWGTRPYIAMIRVLPDWQRRGAGRRLLAFVESTLALEHHRELLSSSQANEPEPQAWHRHMGFIDCGVLAGINDNGVDEIFFRKPLAPHSPSTMVRALELDQAMEAMFEAMKAIVRGDSGPAKAMYSQADDATLANPWGPTVRGWKPIHDMLDVVGTRFRDGECEGIERLAAYVDANVATIVENERWRAKVAGSGSMSPFTLRVTTTFRREAGTWKVVSRHADPITTPRAQGPLAT